MMTTEEFDNIEIGDIIKFTGRCYVEQTVVAFSAVWIGTEVYDIVIVQNRIGKLSTYSKDDLTLKNYSLIKKGVVV